MAYNELARDYNPKYRIGFHKISEELKQKIKSALNSDFFEICENLNEVDLILTSEKIQKNDISKAMIIKVSDEYIDSDTLSLKEDAFNETIEILANEAIYANAIRMKIDTDSSVDEIIEEYLTLLRKKDPYTYEHAVNVAKYSALIAKQLGKTEEEVNLIWMGGILHDIGKICLPDSILFNQTKILSDEKKKVMQLHPILSAIMLPNKFNDILPIVLYHHERFDGKGYPYGLKGDEIPEEALIVAVADCYDAMTTNRSYQNAMSHEKAMGILYELGMPSSDSKGIALPLDKVSALNAALQNENSKTL